MPRCKTLHGKDIANGDGSAVSGMVKKSFYDDYRKGIQSLVRHLAHISILDQIQIVVHVTMEREGCMQQRIIFICICLKML